MTLTRQSDGAAVEVAATWTSDVSAAGQLVNLRLAPTGPLSDGWYLLTAVGTLDIQSGVSDFQETAPGVHTTAFRVGSAPLVRHVQGGSSSTTVIFSEPVIIPVPSPISMEFPDALTVPCNSLAEDLAAPDSYTTFACPDGATGERDVVFAEGIASPTGAPLRDPLGATSFRITLPAAPSGSVVNSWQYWAAHEVPPFSTGDQDAGL